MDEGEYALRWAGIYITGVEVIELAPDIAQYVHSEPNQLRTFWANELYTVSRSTLNNSCPSAGDKVKICSKQLEHEDFGYRIRVNNQKSTPVNATVRIFLAPRHDQDGVRLSLVQQRKYIFMLDVFNKEVQPGPNLLRRHSAQSVVTTARSPTRLLRGVLTPKAVMPCKSFDWKCSCGWPHNLLLPKGKPYPGMEFDLIVMLTDGEKYPWNLRDDEEFGCKVAPIMCSLPKRKGRKYPDEVLPMGYPFDREITVPWGRDDPASTMEDLVDSLENMVVHKITIIHSDQIVNPKSSRWNYPSHQGSHYLKSTPRTLCRN